MASTSASPARLPPQALDTDPSLTVLRIDGLLAHSAFDFAAWVVQHQLAMPASSSFAALVLSGRTLATPSPKTSGVDNLPLVQWFLALKGLHACSEGGLYERLEPFLAHAQSLVNYLGADPRSFREPHRIPATLLLANYFLIYGRICQLHVLPDIALMHFQQSRELFTFAVGRVPPDLELVALRCQLDLKNHPQQTCNLIEQTDLETASPLGVSPGECLWGAYRPHYAAFLKARHSLMHHDPERALDRAQAARNLLADIPHDGLVSQIRSGYLDLLEGRAHLETRSPEGPKSALQSFLSAQAVFHRCTYLPGEYLAARHMANAVARDPSILPTEVSERYKHARRLAELTRVAAFEIESRLDLARVEKALGRLDSVHHEAQAALSLIGRHIWVGRRFEAEHRAAESLVDDTNRWRENAVFPEERWGISSYSSDEHDFVLKMARNPTVPLAIEGPSDVGVALVQRIQNLRHARWGSPVFLHCRGRSYHLLFRDVRDALIDGVPVTLGNFNELPLRYQAQLLDHLSRAAIISTEKPALLSVTIGTRLGDCQRRAILFFCDGLFRVEPLEERPEDIVPLARGFLIQALIDRAEPSRRWVLSLTFTGEASRAIHRWFLQRPLDDLREAMAALAAEIRPKHDFVGRPGASARIPAEVVEQVLARKLFSFAPANVPEPSDVRKWGRAILDIPLDAIPSLAVRYEGFLSRLADDVGVPRSTLVKSWLRSGRLAVWQSSGGRRRTGSRPTPASTNRTGGNLGWLPEGRALW